MRGGGEDDGGTDRNGTERNGGVCYVRARLVQPCRPAVPSGPWFGRPDVAGGHGGMGRTPVFGSDGNAGPDGYLLKLNKL